jgi:hypothetical protein
MLLVYPYHRSGVRPPQPVLAVKHDYNDHEHSDGPSWSQIGLRATGPTGGYGLSRHRHRMGPVVLLW